MRASFRKLRVWDGASCACGTRPTGWRARALYGALLLASLGACAGASDAGVPKLLVEPREIVLASRDESVQLQVALQKSDGSLYDVTRDALFEAATGTEAGATKSAGAAKSIVALERGLVRPLADGSVAIRITYLDPATKNRMEGTASVTVKDLANQRPVSFVNDVLPVLTKGGCNAGACHGKATGQNGFSLSLLGCDAEADYDALVRESRGRRVFPADPAQSLLLLKGAGQVAHGGGQRILPGSPEYQLLKRWIAQGLPKVNPADPVVQRIEVIPRERILFGAPAGGDARPTDAGAGVEKHQQQLRVIAHYSDKSSRDVTARAEYKSQHPDILNAEPDGLVTTLGRCGEGAVMVRYMGAVDAARICLPYRRELPEQAYAAFKPRGFVDTLALAKWKKLGLAPSPRCSDGDFIRRAHLDAIGTLPSADEARRFAADTAPDKRAKLVDSILERPEYADYWASLWGDLLRNKREGDEQKRGTFAFSGWLRNAFARNMPYDQFVREILTAQGEVGDNPPVNWYRHVRNSVHLVNDTSQLFMGTRMSCANCHHHPYEKMSQDDYWAFAGFFERLGKKQGDVPADQAIFVKKEGGASNPRSGKKLKPKGLAGPEFEYVRGEDPRQALVNWMTAPENPYFARAIANRMWAQFMGVGIVNAVDDMRVTNPPSNPELLDALARELAEHKYDLKHLIATILKSEVYSLSSDPIPENAADRVNFARYRPKRLGAETMLDAICAATGVPEKFSGFPLGTRAIQLPDQAVSSYFLNTFGRSQRETACECERSYSPNLSQTLHLMNSSEIQGKLSDAKGALGEMLKSGKKNEQIVEELFLRCLARQPQPEELKQALTLLEGAKDANAKKSALEDFEWVLLNSKEFLFNH